MPRVLELAEQDRKACRERLWSRVETIPESGCWFYVGATSVDSKYGHISVRTKSLFAHRASWMAFVGAIPEGMFVCHKCDIPFCVNPDHLFLGTAQDNYEDAKRKGRVNHRRQPSVVPASVATDIRKRHAKLINELAGEYGLTKHLIYYTIHRSNRGHRDGNGYA